MLKLTKHGITLLNRRYRAVIKHCLMVNIALITGGGIAFAETVSVTGVTAYGGSTSGDTAATTAITYTTKAEGESLATQINKNTTAITTLEGTVTGLSTDLSNLSATVGTKANSSDVYTKTETNNAISNAINGLDASVSTVTGSALNISVTQTDGKITSVTGSIANGAVGTDQIADNAITSAKIANGTITGAKIANGAVGTDQIADSTITSAKIANGAVGTDQLADSAITSAKIADGTITGAKIANGTVGTDQIADSTITSAKIADGAVGTDQIADSAITSAKIANGAVGTDQIADSTITSAKIANGAVGTDQIADNAISSAKIADGTITGADISSDADLSVKSVSTTGNTQVGGTLTVTSQTILNGGLQLDSAGPTVSNIDNGATVLSSGNAETLATTKTVMTSAQNATYTPITGSTLASTTIGDAISELETEKAGLATDNTFSGNNTYTDGVSTVFKIDVSNKTVSADDGNFNVKGGTDGYTEVKNTLYVGKATETNKLAMNATKVASTYEESNSTVTTTGIENGDFFAKNGTNTTFSVDGATGNMDVAGLATLGSLIVGTSGTVTSIDTAGAALTLSSANTQTLATTKTVMTSAENATYTTTGTLNISSGGTLNTAITTLDANLGKVSEVSVNGLTAGSDLTTAVSKLDSNMGSVLGSIYADDGTYSALSGKGFVSTTTGTTNLTTQLTNYAANVQTATGGTFATDGTWSATVNNGGTVGYSYTASANIMDAVNKVATNVGTAAQLTTAGKNGVLTSNSVNSNLDALNSVIGNIADLHNNTNSALTNGTTTAPATVVAALNNIDSTLGTIHGLAAKLSAAGSYQGNLASGTTVEQHLTAIDSAIGNRTYTNQYNVTTGESVAASIDKIDTAMGNVASLSGTHYASGATNLTDGIKSLDNKLFSLNNEVHDLRQDFEAGMAAAAALSALVPNARATGNTQLSFGTGAYQGHTAMAMGGFHWFSDNVLMNAGVAWDNREATYRMGITYSW